MFLVLRSWFLRTGRKNRVQVPANASPATKAGVLMGNLARLERKYGEGYVPPLIDDMLRSERKEMGLLESFDYAEE